MRGCIRLVLVVILFMLMSGDIYANEVTADNNIEVESTIKDTIYKFLYNLHNEDLTKEDFMNTYNEILSLEGEISELGGCILVSAYSIWLGDLTKIDGLNEDLEKLYTHNSTCSCGGECKVVYGLDNNLIYRLMTLCEDCLSEAVNTASFFYT